MRFTVKDVEIKCTICGHEHFDKDYRQLNTKGATLFNLDWANRDAIILVCDYCSHIEWFYSEVEEVPETDGEF